MNLIDKLFEEKKSEILSIYFTAGYPSLDDTEIIIKTLAGSGVDLVEIGMPFSDPMADGPVIQQSNDKALKNGMSLKLLFNQLENIREEVDIPLIMMGYINPVFQYGMENFCRKCHETGIDGVILPDLPYDIYVTRYKTLFEKYNLHKIFLISPQTSPERIMKIDDVSHGFIYMVSSASTTGVKDKFGKDQVEYFMRLKKMNLKNPRLTGFGISNNATFRIACKYSEGAIIGSAFIKALAAEGDLEVKIQRFAKMIRGED